MNCSIKLGLHVCFSIEVMGQLIRFNVGASNVRHMWVVLYVRQINDLTHNALYIAIPAILPVPQF